MTTDGGIKLVHCVRPMTGVIPAHVLVLETIKDHLFVPKETVNGLDPLVNGDV